MEIDFSRLESFSLKLNQASESLNEAFRLVEEKFAQLRLGVDASVELETTPLLDGVGNPVGEVTTCLSYEKRGSKWGLYFIDIDEGGEQLSCEPFSQVSRQLRMKGLKKIPELIKKLEQSSDELLSELRASQNLVEAIFTKKT
jgi:hypothetical protein